MSVTAKVLLCLAASATIVSGARRHAKPLAMAAMADSMAKQSTHWEKCQVDRTCPYVKAAAGSAKCRNGVAVLNGDRYPCCKVNAMSFVPIADMGSAVQANDVWGWTDPVHGKEIVIVCLMDGTSFVDISDATNPRVLGFLRGTKWPQRSIWRDAKVYKDHVFIGSEVPGHGLQIFDLRGLRRHYNGAGGVVVPHLEATAFYGGFGFSHNIVINEETGYLYAVGTDTYEGGPHILDITDPTHPRFMGGWDEQGYTHDAQCVIYRGPHKKYQGREICFLYSIDALVILDVNDDPVQVSVTDYKNAVFCHQGWLNSDMTMLIMNDEQDEEKTSQKHTRSLLWDVTDLEAPRHIGDHLSTEMAIDHNLYLKDDIVYEANYCAGLRVLDGRDIRSGTPELAWFDVAPYCDTKTEDGVDFQGAWSSYPFFGSGNIAVTSIELGLFVLRVQDGVLPEGANPADGSA
eukprot:TRINITY_DN6315_c0_g1_i2.p1 TRINITY_DN6315_c0_g1~~TRINITY_DN6315_c0_g1_i2.p1  ORF type:complete len:460 (+),score=149.33 TRINITY_DN6315_c0_g1_i2:48-1427(+)